MSNIVQWPVEGFVRRLRRRVDNNSLQGKLLFFIGAGCSATSGIPGAEELVERWLPRLKESENWNDDQYQAWLAEVEYDPADRAKTYPAVMEKLFPTPEERQHEIEDITARNDPGFGYSVLAQLMSHQQYRSFFSISLTTNFDDMIADAVFWYTNARPFVVVHKSLAEYVRSTASRPTVIKLHGDARIEPRNTSDERCELEEEVEEKLLSIMSEASAIAFIGYGANDISISKSLSKTSRHSLPGGIFWINETLPNTSLGKWLKERKAIWVKHLDFDELMIRIWKEFDLDYAGDVVESNAGRICDSYRRAFKKLSERIEGKPESEDKADLTEAAAAFINKAPDWWQVELEASKYKKDDPDKADAIYAEGVRKFRDSAELRASYAFFLNLYRNDYDKAEQLYREAFDLNLSSAFYTGCFAQLLQNAPENHDEAEKLFRKAIELDPLDAYHVSNFAVFLNNIRKDYDEAESLHRMAVNLEPNDAFHVNHFARFLENTRRDYEGAAKLYRKAFELDPDNAYHASNFAIFLEKMRQDYDEAEKLYRKAIELDPNNAFYTSNLAIFFEMIRTDYDDAEKLYRKAIELDPDDAYYTCNLAIFLEKIREDYDEAEKLYRIAIDLDPDGAFYTSNLAIFLEKIREDYDEAEKLYKKAIELDPNNANNTGNYAGFLLSRGDKIGFDYVDRALQLAAGDQDQEDVVLECHFYLHAHSTDDEIRNRSLGVAKSLLMEDVRSPDFDLSPNVERAIKDGHPERQFLKMLAKVIADEADISELDQFEVWRNAGTEGSES